MAGQLPEEKVLRAAVQRLTLFAMLCANAKLKERKNV
jgi:hypothetical protein